MVLQCSGVYRSFGVPGCSGVPGFSTCQVKRSVPMVSIQYIINNNNKNSSPTLYPLSGFKFSMMTLLIEWIWVVIMFITDMAHK